MAIKFKCTCGHILSVPDNLAGKSGKCPKCQTSLRVPQPSAKSSSPQPASATSGAGKKTGAGPATAAPAAARPATKPAGAARASKPAGGVVGKLDSLFDDVGLIQKSGPICPSCSADIKPNTVVCTKCGHNFATGEKVVGFNVQTVGPEFKNLHLQEAADNMRRELVMDARREKAAMPWWVLMSFLIGVISLCAAGIIIVDGIVAELSPEDTFVGKLQRLPILVTLGTTAGITGIAITVFAHLSICMFAFGRDIRQGFACFFLPLLYSVVYGIMNWTDNKAPVKAIMMACVFLGSSVGLIVWGGGFDYVTNLFY